MTIFDHINALVYKKGINWFDNLNEEDRKSWSSFMVLRYLSMDYSLLPLTNYLNNNNHKLSDRDIFRLLYELIPKGKYDLKYLGQKLTVSKESNSVKKALKLIYSLTDKEVDEYLKIIKKEDYITIIQMAGLHE